VATLNLDKTQIHVEFNMASSQHSPTLLFHHPFNNKRETGIGLKKKKRERGKKKKREESKETINPQSRNSPACGFS
jgi:hypothetical protein